MTTRNMACFGALSMYSFCLVMNAMALLRSDGIARAFVHSLGTLASLAMVLMVGAYSVWGEDK